MTVKPSPGTEILAAAPISAVLFDVDGTLYCQSRLRQRMLPRLLRHVLKNPVSGMRTVRVIRDYRRALESLRAKVAPEGTGRVDIGSAQLGMAAGRSGVSLDQASRIVEDWFVAEPLRVIGSCVHEGLAEFLGCLASRLVPMAVVSDYEAEDKLQALGIAPYFKTVVTPGITGRLKPHPAVLDQALEILGADRARALYVGDRMDVDGCAAQRAGIRCAILGKGANRPLAGGYRAVPFRSYGELQRLLLPHLESRKANAS